MAKGEPSPRGWLELADDNFEAGKHLQAADLDRPATSCFYYGAYGACQAIALHFDTAILDQLHRNVPHRDLPGQMHQCLGRLGVPRGQRDRLCEALRMCYRLRIDADYRPQAVLDRQASSEAERVARDWLRLSRRVTAT